MLAREGNPEREILMMLTLKHLGLFPNVIIGPGLTKSHFMIASPDIKQNDGHALFLSERKRAGPLLGLQTLAKLELVHDLFGLSDVKSNPENLAILNRLKAMIIDFEIDSFDEKPDDRKYAALIKKSKESICESQKCSGDDLEVNLQKWKKILRLILRTL